MHLAEYLDKHDIRDREAALQIKVSPQTVNRWRHGKLLPSLRSMRRIAKWSEGAVSPNDWLEATQ